MGSCKELWCGICSSTLIYRDDPVLREHIDPEDTLLGIYKSFWEGCTWEPFLVPGPQGQFAIHNRCSILPAKPAVYEFALVKRACTHAKVPVYIGESVNVKSRHRDYAQDGSSLATLMQDYVGNKKFLLYRRVHILESKNQAERWEARFLISFDYAWNAKLNVAKRDLEISEVACCCCLPGVRVVSQNCNNKSLIVSKGNVTCLWYLYVIIYLIELVASLTVIVLIATKLSAEVVVFSGEGEEAGTAAKKVCLIAEDPTKSFYCTYGYVSMAFGLVHSSIALIFLAVFSVSSQSRKMQACGVLSTACVAVLSLAWALVYVNGMTKSTAIPHQSSRDAIEVLSWVFLGAISVPLVHKTLRVLLYLFL